MPFRNKAQRRKFAELLVKGEISEETYEEWSRSTGGAHLPERLHPKPRRKAKKKGKASRAGSKKATRAKPKARSTRRKVLCGLGYGWMLVASLGVRELRPSTD